MPKRRRKPPPNLPRPTRASSGATSRTAPLTAAILTPPRSTTNRAVLTPADSTAPTGFAGWDGETVVGTVVEATPEGVLLDINGAVGFVPDFEMPPPEGESSGQRYAVGDVIEAYVLGTLKDQHVLVLSIQRNVPSYAEALGALEWGSVVPGIVRIAFDHHIVVDIDGMAGTVDSFHPPLNPGESSADRYDKGDQVAVLVRAAPLSDRSADLLIVDDLSTYDAALSSYQVGDVVQGPIVRFGAGALFLDINGVCGFVQLTELPPGLEDAEHHYATGQIVEALVVHIDEDRHRLHLSLRRLAPGYAEAFLALQLGQIVSGTVIAIASRTLWIDVNGLIGELDADELPIDRSQALVDLYSIGDAIEALLWQIVAAGRGFSLSVRRNSPGYAEVLATYEPGMTIKGVVTEGPISAWLDINGVFGLLAGEAEQERHSSGDVVEAIVWQVDHDARMLILVEPDQHVNIDSGQIKHGATIEAVVQVNRPGGIRVLAASTAVFIPDYALALSIGTRPKFEPNTVLEVVVMQVDDDASPKALSHRRTLDGWETEVARLLPGTLVADAQVIPLQAVLEQDQRAAVDLGPVTGFIKEDELDAEGARHLMEHLSNEQYSVVVESFSEEHGYAIVSHEKFDARWRELAADIIEGTKIDAELRQMDLGVAFFDLGVGLIGEMPMEQMPSDDDKHHSLASRIDTRVPVLVTSVDIENQRITLEHQDYQLSRELAEGESATVEFKSTLRVNLKSDDKRFDKRMEDEVLGAIAAFLNTDGGVLYIGVQDDGTALDAVKVDRFTDEDKMSLHLVNLVEKGIDNSVWSDIKISFEEYRGKRILIVRCRQSIRPIYATGSNGQKRFYVRRGPSSKPLEIDEVTEYITRHFQNSPS